MLVKLNEVCDIVPGFAFKGTDFCKSGLPVVKITDINPPNINTLTCSFVDKSKYNIDKLQKFLISKDDYILAMTGATIGKLGKVTSGYAYINQRVAKFVAKGIINSKYLYYVLSTSNFLSFIMNNVDSNSAQPNISASSIGRYQFDSHSLKDQQHIVNILGSIDEKIENNEQKILKLEKFLLNEFSKFSSNISDFEAKKAEEVFNISIGRTPPRQEFLWFEKAKNNNNKKWISIADMGSSNVFIFNTNEYLTNDAITKFNIQLIKPNTVILSFKLTVGRVNITSEEMLSNEAIAHFNTDNKFLLPYTYCYLKSFNYNDLGSTSSIATATNSKSIKNMKFILPNDVDTKHFYSIGNPILKKILSLQKQINKLNELKQLYLKKFFG